MNKAIEIEKLPTRDAFDQKEYIKPEVDNEKIRREIDETESYRELVLPKEKEENTPEGAMYNPELKSNLYELEETGLFVMYPGPPETLDNLEKAEEWATREYEKIRIDPDDVTKISKNTGISEKTIQQIKNHVFYEEHYLDLKYGNFAPDNEQAAAWIRLREGYFIRNDIRWLRHELAESILLKGTAKNVVRPAHKIVNEAGLEWTPPKYKAK